MFPGIYSVELLILFVAFMTTGIGFAVIMLRPASAFAPQSDSTTSPMKKWATVMGFVILVIISIIGLTMLTALLVHSN